MGDRGFVLVYRRLRDDHEAFWTPERKWCWVEVVMRAAYKPSEYRGVRVERGQVVLSIASLQRMFRWTPAKARWFLKTMAERGSLVRLRLTPAGTVYEIPRYDHYQTPRKSRSDGPKKARSNDIANDIAGNTPTQHPRDGAGNAPVQPDLGLGLVDNDTPSRHPLATPLATPRERSSSKEDASIPTLRSGIEAHEGWRPRWVKAFISYWLHDNFGPPGSGTLFPPHAEIGMQTKVAQSIARGIDSPEQAWHIAAGIRKQFPHSPPRNEPWTPKIVRGKLSMCMAASVSDDEVAKAQRTAAWVAEGDVD